MLRACTCRAMARVFYPYGMEGPKKHSAVLAMPSGGGYCETLLSSHARLGGIAWQGQLEMVCVRVQASTPLAASRRLSTLSVMRLRHDRFAAYLCRILCPDQTRAGLPCCPSPCNIPTSWLPSSGWPPASRGWTGGDAVG